MKKIASFLTVGLASFLLASAAVAEPTDVYGEEGPQDPLGIYDCETVCEIGDSPPFPVELERIQSSWRSTELTACQDGPVYDDPGIPNVLVTITSIATGPYCPVIKECIIGPTPVWYVADPQTSLSNYDGWIGNAIPFCEPIGDAQEAFRIDHVGVNRPLVFESMKWDNLLEPGETWEFIIQDYVSGPGGPPAPFDSIGIASLSNGWPPSTGSLITPEPATIGLLALGGLMALTRRRRRA